MANLTKVQKFSTLEKDFNTSVAEALWKKAIQTMNYIEKSYPVGMMLMFHATQSALPHVPDSKYWKECDGSVVSNANSPLNGVTLPDLRDKFFRHPSSGDTVMTSGGVNSVNLAHSHGGVTGTVDNRQFGQEDGDDHQDVSTPHAHSISSDMGSVSTIPLYIALKIYIRIV